MAYEPLEERQVEISNDRGRTWTHHSTYDTKHKACMAVQRLCQENPGKAFKRKAFLPAYKADGTLM